MKTHTVLLCAAITAISSIQAQEGKTEVKPAQPVDAPAAATANIPMDKVSYFIGKNVGGQFAGQPEKIDMTEFIAGVKEALTSKKSTSFTMGTGLGTQFAREGIAVDLEKLAAGIAAANSKEPVKPPFTDEELTAAMDIFEKAMQAKREASMPPAERAAMAKQRAEEEAAMKQMAARAGAAKAEGAKFLGDNGKRKEVTTTKSGLQYEVLKPGTGPKPAITDSVNVHYHGTLINGTVFDSSVERGEPISFPLQGVIKGWTEGLQLMPVGSKWRLFIPSDLAYGPGGSPPKIGPDEALIFDVELLGIVK